MDHGAKTADSADDKITAELRARITALETERDAAILAVRQLETQLKAARETTSDLRAELLALKSEVKEIEMARDSLDLSIQALGKTLVTLQDSMRRRKRWRGWLIALAAMTALHAAPSRAVEAPIPQAGGSAGGVPCDLIILMDASASMKASDEGGRQRSAAKALILGADAHDRIGIVAFAGQSWRLSELVSLEGQEQRHDLATAVDQLRTDRPFTSFNAGLERALYELTMGGRREARWVVVMLSDGIPDPPPHEREGEYARRNLSELLIPNMADSNIQLYSVILSERADFGLFHELSARTSAGYFRAFSDDELHLAVARVRADLARAGELPLQGPGVARSGRSLTSAARPMPTAPGSPPVIEGRTQLAQDPPVRPPAQPSPKAPIVGDRETDAALGPARFASSSVGFLALGAAVVLLVLVFVGMSQRRTAASSLTHGALEASGRALDGLNQVHERLNSRSQALAARLEAFEQKLASKAPTTAGEAESECTEARENEPTPKDVSTLEKLLWIDGHDT